MTGEGSVCYRMLRSSNTRSVEELDKNGSANDCPSTPIRLNVSVGSKADLTTPKCDFRYPPESGLKSDIAPCPKGAVNGLMHRSKRHLYSITSPQRGNSLSFSVGTSK